MLRRAVARTAGVAAVLGLSGCSGLLSTFRGSDADYPTYRRWFPRDGFRSFGGRPPDRFARPHLLSDRTEALGEAATRRLAPLPTGIPPRRIETVLAGAGEGYGTLRGDRSEITDSLGEPLVTDGAVQVYAVGGAVAALGPDRFGYAVLGPSAGAVRLERLAGDLTERVRTASETDGSAVSLQAYDPILASIGAPTVVSFAIGRELLSAYTAAELVAHGWEIGADRTDLRTVLAYPSGASADRADVRRWMRATGGFDAYEDLSIAKEGDLVVLDGTIETAGVTFLGTLRQ